MYTLKSKVTAEARGTVYIPNLLVTCALLIIGIIVLITLIPRSAKTGDPNLVMVEIAAFVIFMPMAIYGIYAFLPIKYAEIKVYDGGIAGRGLQNSFKWTAFDFGYNKKIDIIYKNNAIIINDENDRYVINLRGYDVSRIKEAIEAANPDAKRNVIAEADGKVNGVLIFTCVLGFIVSIALLFALLDVNTVLAVIVCLVLVCFCVFAYQSAFTLTYAYIKVHNKGIAGKGIRAGGFFITKLKTFDFKLDEITGIDYIDGGVSVNYKNDTYIIRLPQKDILQIRDAIESLSYKQTDAENA